MNLKVVSFWLLLLAAFINAWLAVLTAVLVDNGISYEQIYIAEELGVSFLMGIGWVCLYAWNYASAGEYLGLYATDGLDSRFPSFGAYLLSVFPQTHARPSASSTATTTSVLDLDLELESESDDTDFKLFLWQWMNLLGRTVSTALANLFFVIAFSFAQSGDIILIETATMSMCTILLARVFFNEKLNFYIAGAFGACVVGLVLVTQPSFIFTSGTDSMNFFGVLSSFGVGVCYASSVTMMTGSERLGMSGMTAIVVPKLLSAPVAIIIFAVGAAFWDWKLVTTDVFDTWDGVYINVLLCVVASVLYVAFLVVLTVGFRVGDPGRLGIVANSDVVWTYLLGAIVLGDSNNFECYIGVVLVCLGCVVIFYEQWRMRHLHDVVMQGGDTEGGAGSLAESIPSDGNASVRSVMSVLSAEGEKPFEYMPIRDV